MFELRSDPNVPEFKEIIKSLKHSAYNASTQNWHIHEEEALDLSDKLEAANFEFSVSEAATTRAEELAFNKKFEIL